MKLNKQFIKQQGEKPAALVECLRKMQNDGTGSSLIEYTRDWVERTNRGGLFDVSDDAYNIFRAIEVTMIDKLTSHLHSSIARLSSTADDCEKSKEAIVDHVVNDVHVQFHWSMMSVNIEESKHALELLTHVVQLWLTIRGYSISRMWIEDYKCVSKQSTKGKKGLSKSLKDQGQ